MTELSETATGFCKRVATMSDGYTAASNRAPASLQSRVFHLDYLDLDRKGVSKTRISSGQITQGGNSNYSGSGGASTSSDSSSGDGTGGSSSEPTGTAVRTQNDSDLWTGLTADLHAIIGGALLMEQRLDPAARGIGLRVVADGLRTAPDQL